ncbi:MAG: glycosyltransferase [Thermoguttaceae bacterium]|nr:glycosyltransferase [Thermoguttaceae bacterium]MDW8039301.1 glycosyltransferase [Thermoguttaceae bacterium]
MGGAERCLAQLAIHLDRSRFEPIVVSLAPRPPEGVLSCVPMLVSAGIQPYFLAARRWWHLPRVLHQLAALLYRHRIELVQSFLFHANFAVRCAARRSLGKGNQPSASARRPVVVSGIRVAERAAWWHLWLDRWTQQWVDRYVCVSQSVADFTIAQGGIQPEKIVVIPNGVAWENYPSPNRADLTQLGVRPGRKLIVAIGRLEPQKGFGWLISSASQWLRPLADWDLLVVGDGPMRSQLQQEAARQGLADRIHFVGSRADVPEILASSHLLVLASQWEGMPNVLLEAMASGLPVVATRVEGVAEVLGPLYEQQTVAYGDTVGLADRLARILADPAWAAYLGQENQRRVRQQFSLDRMVQAYQQLWSQLLKTETF